jgi:hypothetical protein
MRHILSIQYELRVIILSIHRVFFTSLFFLIVRHSVLLTKLILYNFIGLNNINNKKQGQIIYLFEE